MKTIAIDDIRIESYCACGNYEISKEIKVRGNVRFETNDGAIEYHRVIYEKQLREIFNRKIKEIKAELLEISSAPLTGSCHK